MAKAICQDPQAHDSGKAMPLHALNFEITTLKACNKSWDFKPMTKASGILPAWALNGYLLTGFDLAPDHPVQNITHYDRNAAEVLKELYPRLSWAELTRLTNCPQANSYFNMSTLMPTFGFGWDEHWQKTSELLLQWPLEVQNFVTEKDLRPFDMMILVNISRPTQVALLNKLISLGLSKSLFCQTLELCVEILMLDTPLDKVLDILSQSEALEKLRKVRFPQTSTRDQDFKQRTQSWTWPKGVQAQCQRRGDSLGMEFRFFAKSPDELQKILKSVESSAHQWKLPDNESY